MKQLIIFVFTISIAMGCSHNNKTNNKASDKTNMAISNSDGESMIVPLGKEKGTLISKNEISGNDIKEVPNIASKTGEKAIEGGNPNAENESLKIRRAYTQFKNGTAYYKDGEIQKAIDAFKLSLEYKPDNDKAFYNLGKIYYELGQKDLSMAYYKDAVSLNEDDSLSLLGIGLIYYQSKLYPDALLYYNKAIEAAPYYAMAYFNRGTMLGQNKQYQQSLSDLTNAIKYDPDFSESYLNRGLAYFYSKDMDNACIDWKRAESMGNLKAKDAVRIYCSGSMSQ
ncbi:MAG: tetratricopeptide repeat protein [Bacteroidales bacterium]|jgi:tetratricopeptide (TPR) repeat protein|nr:hypothetical protein [Lentimicrobiaceae bacterium]MDG1135503.1 tetratricopeptide repeat protein [Bacteroidales bacterium]MDG1901855.1 tetratricopeptide repeat protein [Bacteroidales bacterium]MDG2080462.1 tetratricopeptide repeat protein [Bacteroidales bacterium]|tara:strand:- start:29895 stop:30740 length:846 start_codon:yes stop_codon:yes gene_type:complete